MACKYRTDLFGTAALWGIKWKTGSRIRGKDWRKAPLPPKKRNGKKRRNWEKSLALWEWIWYDKYAFVRQCH
jgi:hypothetical protein